MLIELLREVAAEKPDLPLLMSVDRTATYAECLAHSEALGRGLLTRRIDRFGCQLPDPFDILTILCGSSAVGAEACVYPAYLDAAGIDELARAFDHDVVFCTIDELPLPGDGLPPAPDRSPVLILTTGTTSGRPKGARHDWSRLVTATRRGRAEPARWLLAYNLNQFAGIQMMLHVLANAATLVVPRSNQPRDALEAIRQLGVTHASATPTFWRFLVAQTEDAEAQLPQLRQITLGGEAVPEHLLGELQRVFPEATISQVYAATEFGSSSSVRDRRNGLPASILERSDDAGVQMKIVDGQLYTKSKVGMLGYYGEPDIASDEWRPTGDLVEVSGDRIQFVGRSSDTINVGGVKVHPLPVEGVVGAVPGVALARAYGRANPVTGQIVAVDVVAQDDQDRDKLEEAILTACESLPPAARPRRIRFVEELEIRDQKIPRRAQTENAGD